MQLWMEYFLRHGMYDCITAQQKENEPQTIVRSTKLTEFQIWCFFLFTHRHIIKSFDPLLDYLCGQWTSGWEIRLARYPRFATVAQQKSRLFNAAPHLESVWSSWTRTIDFSRLSEFRIDT